MLDVGMQVNTAELLEQVQRALKQAERRHDQQLKNVAETVLSALMVVARRDKAPIPGVLREHVDFIRKALDSAA
jgi:phage terminase Nu1 subunit (DNA packaging protein)